MAIYFLTKWINQLPYLLKRVGPKNPVLGADCAQDLGFLQFLRYFLLTKSSIHVTQ